MVKPRAILIDLDDTLIAFDAGNNLEACWLTACTEFAEALPETDLPALVKRIRARARDFWGDPERRAWGRLNLDAARVHIVKTAFGQVGIEEDELANQIAKSYVREREAVIHVFPGAVETVAQLRAKGIKLALVTNGDAATQRRKVNRFQLEPLFDTVLIEGEFGYGKPHQAVYLEALNRLGTKPEETWMVGDNYEWEVVGPMQHGIRGIWIDHAGEGLPETAEVEPYAIIHSITELPALLEMA